MRDAVKAASAIGALALMVAVMGLVLPEGTGGGGDNFPENYVVRIIAGDNIDITPDNGLGIVTIAASGINVSETVSRSIYVDHDLGSDSNGGASWGDAFQTLQHAVDSIKPIVDGCTITIYARGALEQVYINRLCTNDGVIALRADNWIEHRQIVSATNNTVTISGNYTQNYWVDCYVAVDVYGSGDTKQGQVRLITASIDSGANTVLTLASNWGSNPTSSYYVSVWGRASINTDVQGEIPICVTGKSSRVEVYGFEIEQTCPDGEEWAVLADGGSTLWMYVCGVSGVHSEDGPAAVYSSGGSFIWLNRVALFNNGSRDFWVTNGSDGYILNSIIVHLDYGWGIHASYVSRLGVVNCYIKGGDKSIVVEQNSTALYGAMSNIWGVDGHEAGIFIDSGSQVTMSGSTDLSITYGDSFSGHGMHITDSGAGATMGWVQLIGSQATVNTTAVTNNSYIFLSHKGNVAGAGGIVYINGVTAGSHFHITSTLAGDAAQINWLIIEPV